LTRILRIGGAQMGPIQKADARQAVVARMLDLLDQAKAQDCNLVVYPELTLTTFFPRWHMTDQAEIDVWFEREMPNTATGPLFEKAAKFGIGLSFGYAELTPDGRHFNTSILVDRSGCIVGKYRKVHLPGHSTYEPERAFQHLEKRYFEPGDLGFPVWRTMNGILGMCICNDRRWPETYRVMGLQGVELIVLGYNTPSINSQRSQEGPQKRLFHHRLCLQAGAYQNSTWVVAVAKCGTEDNHSLIGGSIVVSPDGEIVTEAGTNGDELIVADCDLDETSFGKQTIFDFARHRRVEHYARITSQTGVTSPLPALAHDEAGSGAPTHLEPTKLS
jgi:N-carbamoyl-D-amino-acid hydrolase